MRAGGRVSSLTCAGVLVGVQQVTVATGAVVPADVVVAEMVAGLVLVVPRAALVHVCGDRRRFWFWFWRGLLNLDFGSGRCFNFVLLPDTRRSNTICFHRFNLKDHFDQATDYWLWIDTRLINDQLVSDQLIRRQEVFCAETGTGPDGPVASSSPTAL